MENPKQQQQQRQADDEIAVLELHFNAGHRVPVLPFEEPSTNSSLRARDRVSISYSPRKRFYKITEKTRDPKGKDVVFYVHESWALFVPAEP